MTSDSIQLQHLRNTILSELKPVWGSEEAFGISNLIFEHFGFTREFILREPTHLINKKIQSEVKKILLELKQNTPIQYILGYAYFYDLKLDVNPKVLIPRPETEELVDLIIKEHKNNSPTILDIGTGSGCIPITLAKYIPNSRIFAMDIDSGALETARKNALTHEAKVGFIQENILLIPEWNAEILPDVIVSNPPYVTKKEKALMLTHVVEKEPHLALFVEDEDPLIFYRAIAEFAKKNCTNACELYLEINEQFGKETAELLRKFDFENVLLMKDMQGKDRIIKATIAHG